VGWVTQTGALEQALATAQVRVMARRGFSRTKFSIGILHESISASNLLDKSVFRFQQPLEYILNGRRPRQLLCRGHASLWFYGATVDTCHPKPFRRPRVSLI
jgi:hypothetical protein